MEIILLRSVDNLGIAGDVVNVRPGYYRNFLAPRGMAMMATASNRALVESRRKKLEAMVKAERASAEATRNVIHGAVVTYELRANDKGQLFGSVTTSDIMAKLRELGHAVDRRQIEIGEAIKRLGDHKVRIRLYSGVYAEVKVVVNRELRPGEALPAEEAPAPEAPAAEATAEAGAEA